MKLAEREPFKFFVDTWRELDEARAGNARAAASAAAGHDGALAAASTARDYEPTIALVVAAVALTLMDSWGGADGLLRLMAAWDGEQSRLELGARLTRQIALDEAGYWSLTKLAYWSLWRVLGYFALPVLVLGVRGQRIRDQHFAIRGIGKHAHLYALAYLAVLVGVVGVSFSPDFTSYYPFYREAYRSWSDLLAWEAMYIAHFFAIEFFFRGYLLNACRSSLGSHAIFVAMVPYVMVHFGKPVSETLGAIGAGVALGTLAMKTRSIWLGFVLHVAVALSMDAAAMLQTTGLPTRWWPAS